MMILDFHTHLLDRGHWPEEWWDYVANEWAKESSDREPAHVRGRIEDGLIDPDASRMIVDMDEAGVDQAIILPIDWGPDFNSKKSVDDVVNHAIQCQEAYPERLIAFGGIDPRRPGAPEKVDEWLKSGKIHGLKMYPNCGWLPGCNEAMAVYEVCVKYDVPILFHTGHPLPLLDQSWSSLDNFLPVVEAFPTLKAVLGHAGAPCEFENALKVAERSEAASLELSVCLWDDQNVEAEIELARRIAKAIEVIGSERILFGTDHVSGKRIRGPGFLKTIVDKFLRMPDRAREAGTFISEKDMENIMGMSAMRQLKRNY